MKTKQMTVLTLEVVRYNESTSNGTPVRKNEGWPYGTFVLWKHEDGPWQPIPGSNEAKANVRSVTVTESEGHIVVSFSQNLIDAWHTFELFCHDQ